MSCICALNVQTIRRRNVSLQNDIANYWPGMCNTACLVVFMDQCEQGYFWQCCCLYPKLKKRKGKVLVSWPWTVLLTGRLSWRTKCPLSSLRRPRWSRPALRGLQILQCPLLGNARSPARSCLLHRCRLAAPPLALSPPSVRCEPRGSAILPASPGLEYPSPPPPASEARTPPRPVDPVARWSAPWNRRPLLLHGSSLRRLHRGPSS